ncbi:MAG: D-alanyl-D-alanine carboxypeptidase [Oscillospiraceae bacterium]|nr:D-alanyl-D-alanine carboxypeptidase [Oscillospiraceae bacterium]
MFRRKNIKNFSTILFPLILVLSVFICGQAGFPLFAAADNANSDEGGSETGDGIFVLGGIHPDRDIMSDGVYVYNMDTGVAVYSKNADKRLWPASTTKIMTALVVLEYEKNLEKKAEYPQLVTAEFMSGDPNKQEAATAGFDLNDDISIRDALYGMMLPSGCEAANILAYNIGEGQPEERINNFVQKMNDLAAKLGAENTHFSNAHGLFEPENYSTAYDMFLITKYAYEKHSFFPELVNTVEYAVPISQYNPDGVVVNTNWLLRNTSSYYYQFAKGIKTGGFDSYYTRSNGEWVEHPGLANLVSVANRNVDRDNYRYMIVTMGAPWLLKYDREGDQQGLHHAFNDHKALYGWAFSSFENDCIIRTTDPLAVIKVLYGSADEVQLFPMIDSDFWTLLPNSVDADSAINPIISLASDECSCGSTDADTDKECECDIREGVVSAPIAKGDVLGTMELQIAGQSLVKLQLMAGDAVAKTSGAIARDRLSGFFGQKWFIPLILLLGAAIIVLIIMNYINRHRRRLAAARKRPPNKRIRR